MSCLSAWRAAGQPRPLRFVLLAAVAACCLSARAESPGERGIALRGFGTLGAVHSSERNADFVHGFFEPNGAGATRRWAFGIDSRLGLQADARFAERLSGVLQVVAQHRYDNSYTPRVEWANLKYELTPDLDVRIGRTPTMPFLVSDARLVGYANPWVRPPQELYGLIPITSKDGVDLTYKARLGAASNTLQAAYGGVSLKLPGGGRVKAKRYFSLADTVEYGPFAVRLGLSSGRVDLSTPATETLFAGYASFAAAAGAVPALRPVAAQASAIRERYRFDETPISLVSAALTYDRGPWLLMAEWARFNGHSLLANSTAWYGTAAYRVGSFTPYVTLARLKATPRTVSAISTAGLPASLATSAANLNTGLADAIAGAAFAQRSGTIGVRWDFARDVALKVQYDRIDLDPGSSGRLRNVQAGFQYGATVNVLSIAVDFVF